MSSNPFDYINAITHSKEDLLAGDPQVGKQYNKVKYLVNRGLSYFPDTILYANEMNRNSAIPADWQFFFLLNSIPKKKRFSKWAEKEPKTESLRLVMEYYGYSIDRARESLKILSDDQLNMIKEKLYKGGR